ncbi:Hypothetical protein CINCED_3A011831 [Cinara cedri]|uniref:NUDE domain-containing protein n=1 Tax=Cinara cedri TaxID=506608 RepID=A0A5E4NI71_9HEMI|nr:Hypothetical protein CINCED_3A011831 [Cinara cedri]
MTNPNETDSEDWKDKYRALEKEYDDFREQSQSLERELEMDVEMLEKNNKELKSKNNQLQFDLDTLRTKNREEQQNLMNQIHSLQEEAIHFHERETNYVKYIRELEQKTEDLEKLQRETCASLGDFETKMNDAIERNALLEVELDEKESLQAMVQRLKDEISELKQEIQSKERKLNPDMNESQAAAAVRRCSSFRAAVDNRRLSSSTETAPKSHTKSLSGTVFHSPPAKLARVGDIVGDLMRKVLELKLVEAKQLNVPKTQNCPF